MKAFAAVLPIALFALTLSAQEASPAPGQIPENTLRVSAKLVVLDVVVTDAKGKIVHNLKKDDFEVYEDKTLQRIRSFEETGSASPAPGHSINSTAELDRLAPNAPVSIIVLDEITSAFTDEAFTRISLKRYLGAQGDALPQPIMLVAVDHDHFDVLRDYTTSKTEILSALDRHFAANPWQAQNSSFASEEFDATFVSLMEIAQATAGHPGHKNMIWIGRGFPLIDPTGMLPEDVDALHSLIESCTNMLRDSRVTLYTVDPAGLSVQPATGDANGFLIGDPFGGQIDFNIMAEATGGKAFFGRNDVDNLIGTSVSAGTNFYTLAYAPTNRTDTSNKSFRNITIRLKDRSLSATTRSGYYHAMPPPSLDTAAAATDAESKMKNQIAFDITVASNSTMVYDGVPFTVSRSPSVPDEFQIHLEAKDIAWEPSTDNKLKAEVTLLVGSYDKRGKQLKRSARTIHLASNPASPNADASPIPLDLHVVTPTEAPAARIRLVVRMNSTGKIGAQNYDLVSQKSEAPSSSPQLP